MVIYISIIFSLVLYGCSVQNKEINHSYIDKKLIPESTAKMQLYKTQKNTKHILSKRPPVLKKAKIKKYDIFKEKFFTFSADNAPLSTVLYTISKDTGLNIIISPEVDKDKTITATFNHTPLKNALDIIMEITGLYYEIKGNVLYIKELKTKSFKIPFVNMHSKYNVSLGGDVLGTALAMGASGGGSGVGAGSGGGGFSGNLGGGGTGLTGNYSLEYKTPSESDDFYTIIEKDISELLSEKGEYVLNKVTGVLVVTDKIKNIKRISNYINRIKKELQKQVLIEARIVEVQLSNEYQFGVDWSVLINDIFNTGASLTIAQNLALSNGAGVLTIQGSNFNTLLNALKKVGKVKTLANPRIRVLNGQSALISTGRIVPFWEKQIQTLAAQFATQQVTFLRSSVLDGILLGVSVHINEEGSVIMNVVPVSSRMEGVKQFKQNDEVVAEAPILNIKETGTVIKANDGDMIIIGGLISEENEINDEMIPELSSLKIVGGIFKKKLRKKVKKELIIFLKPRIVNF